MMLYLPVVPVVQSTPMKVLSFVTLQPIFTVYNWEIAQPIFDDFVKRTREEASVMYYDFTRTSDQPGAKVVCREAYPDASALLAHLENVMTCLERLCADGVAKLDEVSLHGPFAELDKCKSTTDAFGTLYYEIDSGFSRLSKDCGGVGPRQMLSIYPTFTIKNWEKAKPIMEEFVHRTMNENKCLWYGWTKTSDKLFCREAYDSAEGLLEHLANVGSCVDAILSDDIASLDKIEFHGPPEEIEKCKETGDAMGVTYFTSFRGFQRFE